MRVCVCEWAGLLAVVQADALGYLPAAEGAVLQSVAAHQAAAHVAAGQEDHLSLKTKTGSRAVRAAAGFTSLRISGRRWKTIVGRILTPVSMQTTHSELPGPSTGLGADGVTGVPGVCGEPGMWKALGSSGGDTGPEGPGATAGSSSSSSSCCCSAALHAPAAGEGRHESRHLPVISMYMYM